MSHESEALDAVYRAIAMLEVSLTRLGEGQSNIKSEIRTLSPRIEVLVARIETLSAEISQLGERLHRTNNLVQVVLTDALLLQEAQTFLQRLIEVVDGKVDHLRKVALEIPPKEGAPQ